jgi:ABC-2 type transport system permease protein
MKKTFFVLKYEVINILTSRSFLLVSIGIPLVSALIFALVTRLSGNTTASSVVSQIVSAQQETKKAEGYVDQAGIIHTLPVGYSQDTLIAYPDEASASAALNTGQIAAYYVVPENFIQKGKLIYVRPDFNPLTAAGKSYNFERLLRINLLDGNVKLADQVNMPLLVETQSLAPTPQRDQQNPLTFWIPYAVTMIYYVVILGAASLLLSSVTKEKENRVIEILMASATPQQLLAGKIIGLGIVGLGQAALWVGTGYGLLHQGSSMFNLPKAFQLPAGFLVWGAVFFMLGYAVYASLMAGLGALVPNMREASQSTMIVAMPLIVPLFLMNVLIEDPNGTVSTALSLFPLTAPVVMMTRLSAGGVAWWQPPLAAVLLVLTVALVVRAVSGMFRAQTILSGQPFNVQRFLKALAGKV